MEQEHVSIHTSTISIYLLDQVTLWHQFKFKNATSELHVGVTLNIVKVFVNTDEM